MKISITGFRKVAFKPDNSNDEIRGTSVYYCYEDDRVEGIATGKLFLPENRNNPFKITKTYEFQYNRYGKIDWSTVVPCDP